MQQITNVAWKKDGELLDLQTQERIRYTLLIFKTWRDLQVLCLLLKIIEEAKALQDFHLRDFGKTGSGIT